MNKRWHMMLDSIIWDDVFIAKLDAMNEKMKQALIEMRNLALYTYNHLLTICPDDKTVMVKSILGVDDMDMDGWEYGSDMWAYLTEILKNPELSLHSLYEYGVAFEMIIEKGNDPFYYSDNQLLYHGEEPENWNEYMDSKKTEYMHIIYGVHNMIDHCGWTLQDLINVKSYYTKIEIEYRNKENG